MKQQPESTRERIKRLYIEIDKLEKIEQERYNQINTIPEIPKEVINNTPLHSINTKFRVNDSVIIQVGMYKGYKAIIILPKIISNTLYYDVDVQLKNDCETLTYRESELKRKKFIGIF